MEIDKEFGNTLRMDAVHLEMQNVRIALKEYSGNPNLFVDYTHIQGSEKLYYRLWYTGFLGL